MPLVFGEHEIAVVGFAVEKLGSARPAGAALA
jgi:hypothetical protein